MDDDVITTCSDLRKGFRVWRKQAIGDVGPLMGYAQRSFNFSSFNSSFFPVNQEKFPLYQITLIGLAWIPRLFLELYNANNTW